MAERVAEVTRTTTETKVLVRLDLDGGDVSATTGVPFFDHMLDQLGRHGGLGLTIETEGDLHIDAHHTVEDTGIALGEALLEALGDKRGIRRYGDALVPMEEALAQVALDISGRPLLVYTADIPAEMIGQYEVGLTEEFLQALTRSAGLTIHVTLVRGRNAHHSVEAIFKALRACPFRGAIDRSALGRRHPVDQRNVVVHVAVLDHGMGNIRSVSKALEAAGAEVTVTADPEEIGRSDGLCVPGQGIFGRCMENIERVGASDLIVGWVGSGKPFLGICLGMQVLFEHSEEGGGEGLGILGGNVTRLPNKVPVPHIGWNTVNDTYFYFDHSYAAHPSTPGSVKGWCTHGDRFAAWIEDGPLLAVQFHPEKSGKSGIDLLRKWVENV